MGPRALPLLEPGRRPQPAKWYRLSPRGDRPRGRVGHGCLFLPGGGTGRVLLLGGADPAGAFADAHFVELGAHRWVAAGWSGLRPRYEHATFLPATDPPRLWVFGGAHPAGNRSCVQALDLETGTWESPEVSGVQPLPRTFHTSSAAVGDCLYVFGGGDKGAEPVKDQQLHVFDSDDMRWVKIPATGDVPGGRASHSSAVFKDHLYIFGGIGPDGTLDTTYKYHTEKQQWTLLQFDSPLPPGRLDHTMCVIPWQAGKSRDTGAVTRDNKTGKESTASVGDKAGPLQESQEEEGCAEDTVMHLLLIFGGMDTQGEIYRDCIVSLID
ncbi:rab9 effector protein with kelch motifs isoform X2 [Accipiter gentilis]|uniref:rab9 effector protein with kelch motifs isoform X2 n=1 Tax=Astur gentilis TaxID=8957 RepID=UPI00211058B2|nr:rab9 effector protein with kelch motifs isoform X2 [Accipiter gentilis]